MNKNDHRISSRQAYAASLGIASILFLWPIQIYWETIGVPVYLFTSVFLVCFSRFTAADIIRFMTGMICLFALLCLQMLQGISLSTPLRIMLAIPVFSFIITCAYLWLRIVLQNGPFPLFNIFRIFLFGQLLTQLYQLAAWMAGLYYIGYQHHYFLGIPRVSGFFTEPSHIVFSLSPFIYLVLCRWPLAVKWLGKIGLTCLGLTFALCPSSTIIPVVGFALFLRQIQSRSFRSVVFSMFLLLLGGCLLILAIDHIPAVSSRVYGVANLLSGTQYVNINTNLSVLMFLKGWQMALAGLQHYFLGVGFLNFQILNDYSFVSFLSNLAWEMNAMGGTSVAFKLIGEFGYIGLLIILFIFIALAKNIRQDNYKKTLGAFFLFGLIASFVRGASYFDGIPILAFAVLYRNIHLYFIRSKNSDSYAWPGLSQEDS